MAVMELDKVEYIDQDTRINAENLNDIQDAIIDLEETRLLYTVVSTF